MTFKALSFKTHRETGFFFFQHPFPDSASLTILDLGMCRFLLDDHEPHSHPYEDITVTL